MARINKETKSTIIAALNDFIVSISDREEIDLEFGLTDDGVNSEIILHCKKPSKSGGLKRTLGFKDGVIQVDRT